MSRFLLTMDDADGQPIVAYRKQFMNIEVEDKTEDEILSSLQKLCSGNEFLIDYNLKNNGTKCAVRIVAIP